MDTTATFWMPPAASTISGEVDGLFMFLVWMSTFFFVLIVASTLIFLIKWRRRAGDMERLDKAPSHHNLLEASWIVIPTILVLFIFTWGFRTYMKEAVVPANALQVKVTAQKWFWSFTYPDGANSVNELVVPVGQPVKLLMSSQDVIHCFFVPAFRIKRDVLPNRYQFAWFQATREGEFDLFCAEYCGTNHSRMLGRVRVMNNTDYHAWLDNAASAGEGMSLAERGRNLYKTKGCATCHSIDGSPGNGPGFLDIFGHETLMSDGSRIVVDENYIRESILNPKAHIVAGFQPIMPTFQGILNDKDIDALVEFIEEVGGGGDE